MSSIGTGYDLSAQTFSPAGRVFQVEYAGKAVENSGTVIALRGKDGVVFAAENIITSKLHERSTYERTFAVGRHIGIAVAGLVADGRAAVSEARSYAAKYRNLYGSNITSKKLSEELAGYMHQYTLHGSVRPFGCSVFIGSFDKDDGAGLYMIEPSGVSWGYYGCAMGKAKQGAQAEIEKLKLSDMSVKELVNEAARIIHSLHDEVKDKDFILELSWVCEQTNGQFQKVPKDVYDAAEAHAKAAMEESDDDDDDDDED